MSRDLLPPGIRQIHQPATACSSRRILDEELQERIRLKAERHRWMGRGSFLGGVATAIGFLALLL
jgi:hypothetical protein